ncbi:site-specific DNA-methyltransferase [Methylomonas rapida]|uniref:Site-specific DNA-methyltransferase n=1 Tax=Methylomonas rapida TaxID=2963939 RepID=A0ABY7GH70_9GAMM|nr:site-specific DNA-methyltransferase [Methylomonas rapida]WAR44602.1 site-specific DNA-methyltransferase [Methylomonas rapida]
MAENTKKPRDVTVAKAKGRPMLTWVGKKPLARVTAYPSQAIERFDATAEQNVALQNADWSDWPKDLPQGGLLYHGDNKDVLAHLLANGFRGKVKLIYIDPPFDSGADYVRKVQLRGAKGTVKIDGEDYALGEQIQYSDIWANDNYLQFMYERLLMLKELLSNDGSIYLHCDQRKSHHLKIVADEVFGPENFRNEISWKRTSSHNDTTDRFSKVKDTILFYSKGDQTSFNTTYLPYTQEYIDSEWNELASGRYYKCENMLDPQGKMQMFDFHGTQARWRTSHEKMEALWNAPQAEVPNSHGLIKLGKNGKPIKRCKIVFMDELPGVQLSDVWDDISYIAGRAQEAENYPTQKPKKLLERIVFSSSNPGDLVLDCFVGSGTTVAVSQALGRRWIGCDINKGAIQTTAKRLQTLMQAQQAANRQGQLFSDDNSVPQPCQLGFSTWRVNDYDLQIQHNEAVDLACQYLGVTRSRTDAFFDGTQGGRLVKIVPFNHPLTPLDLEALRTELKNRPDEERDVLMVSLGVQHDARQWLDDYNRNRPVNRLHLIELRTDRKYGGIIKHEPLTADVSVSRDGDKLLVEIHDVLSPTIIHRLNLEQGVFKAQITDWRAVVDCVLIDTQHDDQIFNVVLSDVPERKQDLVVGRYELSAPPVGSVVAVKLIDMLGEELILRFDV